MKKKIQIIKLLSSVTILMMICSLTSQAQEIWEWQHPVPLGSPPTGLQIISEDTLYLTARSGAFYKTADGGQTWDIIYLNTSASLSSPKFANAQVGFVTTADSEVFKTTDAGETWEKIYEDRDEFQYTGMDVYDENHAAISAQKSFTDSKLLITSDGGATWKIFDSGVSENADSIFYDGGLWEVDFVSPDIIYTRGGETGSREAFYRTVDGGENWETFEISVEGDTLVTSYMEALQFVNDTVGGCNL